VGYFVKFISLFHPSAKPCEQWMARFNWQSEYF